MRTTLMIFCALGLIGAGSAYADQTVGEKASAKAHDAKRKAKKFAHRAEEVVCAEGDAKCLAEKAKNRGEEAGDYVKDKSKEAKDKVD